MSKQFWIPLVLAVALMSCGEQIAVDQINDVKEETSQEVERMSKEVTPLNKKEVKKNVGTSINNNQFKSETVMNGMNVKLIMNSAAVPIGAYTDFYLKIEGVEPLDVTVASKTNQGIVSKNKEPYYFGVKGMRNAKEIELMINVADEEGNRTQIGSIMVPVETNK